MRRWGGPPAGAIHLPDGRWLVARAPHDRHRPVFGLFFVLALVAIAVGVGAYPVVRRLTARLERLQAGVESLGAGDLSARVKVEGSDEVARLAASFNRAAGRIEELVGAHKSLLANASHELRTPLARIRMAVELLKENADPERKRASSSRTSSSSTRLIDEILTASRLDAIGDRDANEEVDLLALASEECARYEEAQLTGEPVTVRGDPRPAAAPDPKSPENARRHGAPPVEVQREPRRAGPSSASAITGRAFPDAEREGVFQPVPPVCRQRRARRGRAGAGAGPSDCAPPRRRRELCCGRAVRGSFVVTLHTV